MKRKNAQTKTADAVTLMAVERERERDTDPQQYLTATILYIIT